MNNHMLDSHFLVKRVLSLDILPKNETHPDMFFKGVALPQNSHLLISLPLFCSYEVQPLQYRTSIAVFIKLSFQIFKF